MINYKNISDSIMCYEKHGFTRIEAPWTVTKEISHITKPNEINNPDFELKHNNKVLVASGEQSFLYLYTKGFLPKGKFMCVTPCFRYESFDELHKKYFIKNELIDTIEVNKSNLNKMIDTAFNFFSTKLDKSNLEIVTCAESYDIQYNGIELGSYGIRECSFLKWIYGTGCAEPRLSYCQNLKKNLNGIPSEANQKR